MARQIVVDIVGDSSKFTKSTKDATDSSTKLTASLKNMSLGGFAIGAGIGAASAGFAILGDVASKAGEFLGSTIEAASGLNETVSKSNVIFGTSADAMQDWATTMDTAGGLSERAALDAASGFAGLFKTVGLGIEQSVDMSKGLTQLGSDLASFFNTDVSTALDALKSGLNGEAEPLRQFNVFLSDAALKAELAREGVKAVGGTFTEAQKATARYNIILQQTTDAQGDFVRTSDGLANQTRILNADMENLQAKLGQYLLPVMKEVTAAGVAMAGSLTTVADSGASASDRLGGVVGIVTQISDAYESSFLNIYNVAQVTDAYTSRVEEQAATLRHLSEGLDGATRDMDKLTFAEQDAARAAVLVTDKVEPLRTKIGDTGRAFEKTRDAVNDLSDAFLEAAFTPEQLKLELQLTNRELKDQKGHLIDLEAQYDKHPTRKLKTDILELKLAISQSTEKSVGLQAKIDALDGTTTKEVQAEIRAVGGRAANAAPEVRALTSAVQKLDGAAEKAFADMYRLQHGPGPIPHASGGPVLPGGVYTVGERGPETLVMGGGGVGYVLPHSSGPTYMGGGSGSMVQNINVNIESFTGSDRDIDHFADRLALRMRLAGA